MTVLTGIHAAYSSSEPVAITSHLKGDTVSPAAPDADDYRFWSGDSFRRLRAERKEASDLIHSFLTPNEGTGEPRLIAELRKLTAEEGGLGYRGAYLDDGTLFVLLLEGHLGCTMNGLVRVGNHKTGVPYSAIDNLLVAIQGWGIRIVHSPGISHTAARLNALASWWLDSHDESPIIMLPKAPAPQLRTLMTFPGVGIKTAQDELHRQGNLRDVMVDLLLGGEKLPARARKALDSYLDAKVG